MGAGQEADNIALIPDGNGKFTAGMGQLFDKADLGIGKRSWRHSLLVKDGVVEEMFVAPYKPGDPFKVSDADTVLNYPDPRARKPDQVVVFARAGCGYCAQATAALKKAGYSYVEVPVAHQIRSRVLGALVGAATVPPVFIDIRHIGGAEEVAQLLRTKTAASGWARHSCGSVDRRPAVGRSHRPHFGKRASEGPAAARNAGTTLEIAGPVSRL
jgi:glutaredoxin-like protein